MYHSISVDRLIDFVMEWFDANNDYIKSSRAYYKKYHYGVCLNYVGRYAETTEQEKEELHIQYAYEYEMKTNGCLSALMEVLKMDVDTINRLYSAGRFMKKWYEKTNWERLPSAELEYRIYKYIFE